MWTAWSLVFIQRTGIMLAVAAFALGLLYLMSRGVHA